MSVLTIEYCVVWNYKPRAAGLADSIKERLGLDAKLVKSANGRFEVSYDGDLVFSKKALGRFPQPGEVEDALAERLG